MYPVQRKDHEAHMYFLIGTLCILQATDRKH